MDGYGVQFDSAALGCQDWPLAGSAVAFTNTGGPPLPLVDGLRVRIRWLADPWFDDGRRVLRLEVAGMPPRG